MKYSTIEQATVLLLLSGYSEAARSRRGGARGGDSVAKAGNRIATSYRISNLSTGPESSFNFGVNADQKGGKVVSQDTPLIPRDVIDQLLHLEARSDDDGFTGFDPSYNLLAREADGIIVGQFGGNAKSGPGAPNFGNGRAGGDAARIALPKRGFMDGGKGGDARGGSSKSRAGNRAYHSKKIDRFTANGNRNTFDFSSSSTQTGGNAQSGPGGANYGNGGEGGKGGDLSIKIPAMGRRDVDYDGLEARSISDDEELSLYLYARHLAMELDELEARDLEDEQDYF